MEWRLNEKERFVNPYNFVTLGEKSKKDKDALLERKKNDKITGYIECELETKTPIFIPNITNDKIFYTENNEHKSYDFYSYEDLSNKKLKNNEIFEPVIPGSSIRGVIRNVYETLTNSCMSVVDDEKPLYKRFPDPGQAALIIRENGRVLLYKSNKVMVKYKKCDADRNLGKDGVEIKNYSYGEKVWIEEGNFYKGKSFMPKVCKRIEKDRFEGGKEGYVITGGDFGRKHHFTVILRENSMQLDIIKESDIKRLQSVVDLYLDETINKEKKNFQGYKNLIKDFINKNTDVLPVFYKKVNGVYYLSPACITKEVYNNTIGSILKQNGEYNPCNDIKKLCDCCNLFGMVGEEKSIKSDYSNSNSSRLRFEDARLSLKQGQTLKDVLMKEITIKELSSPKISSTEFYLFKPNLKENVDIWTYDYAVKWKNNSKESLKGYNPKIRGRKFFWHHFYEEKFDIYKIKDNKQTKRNITIRPVNSNLTFKFNIYFDRISKKELEKLIWILNLGSNKNNNMHKIGMAKPLGLGSVKVKVKDVIKRNIELQTDNILYNKNSIYNELKISEDGMALFGGRVQLNELKKITMFSKIGDISYPIVGNKADLSKAHNDKRNTINTTASHQWFTANKQIKGKGTKPIIELTLPNILDKDISLPKIEKNYSQNKKSNKFYKK